MGKAGFKVNFRDEHPAGAENDQERARRLRGGLDVGLESGPRPLATLS
jgi:hypothetical protein